MKIRVITVCTIILFCFSTGVKAQDSCRDILEQGIYNLNINNFSTVNKEYKLYWLCSQTYQSSSSENGAGIKAIYEGIPIGGDYNQSNFESFKQSTCTQSVRDAYHENKTFIMSQIVSSEIVTAWSSCMSGFASGLSSELIDDGGNHYSLKLNYRSVPKNAITPINMERNNIELEEGNSLPSVIESGDINRTFFFKRDNDRAHSFLKISSKDKLGNIVEISHRLPPKNLVDILMIQLKALFTIDTFGKGWTTLKYFINIYGIKAPVQQRKVVLMLHAKELLKVVMLPLLLTYL